MDVVLDLMFAVGGLVICFFLLSLFFAVLLFPIIFPFWLIYRIFFA